MQRFTISIDDILSRKLDAYMSERGYINRSEVFRDLLRNELREEKITEEAGECTAIVSYMFNHHERRLSEKMTKNQHDHGRLIVSSMHVHVTESDCIETVVLRGPTGDVKKLGKEMIAEKGVRHGTIHIIPVESDPEAGDAYHHEHHDHPLT